MHTTPSRSSHADHVEAELRDASCCDLLQRCAECHARADELRAIRRDAVLHALATVRPRGVQGGRRAALYLVTA
jgi:hypothetical protein